MSAIARSAAVHLPQPHPDKDTVQHANFSKQGRRGDRRRQWHRPPPGAATGAGRRPPRHLRRQPSRPGRNAAADAIRRAGAQLSGRRLQQGRGVRARRRGAARFRHQSLHFQQCRRVAVGHHRQRDDRGNRMAARHQPVGVIYGTKAFLPMLLQQREGHIVNISSIFGIVAFPCKGAYNVSKFGVRGWTECLWQELEGSGVRAVSVHPGGIRTEIAQTSRVSVNAGATERRARALSEKMLTTPPEDMARAILRGIARGKQRIVYGNKARTLTLLQRWLPGSYGTALRLLQSMA